jgi:hypothetical protein
MFHSALVLKPSCIFQQICYQSFLKRWRFLLFLLVLHEHYLVVNLTYNLRLIYALVDQFSHSTLQGAHLWPYFFYGGQSFKLNDFSSGLNVLLHLLWWCSLIFIFEFFLDLQYTCRNSFLSSQLLLWHSSTNCNLVSQMYVLRKIDLFIFMFSTICFVSRGNWMNYYHLDWIQERSSPN